jgi:hypothetical protein
MDAPIDFRELQERACGDSTNLMPEAGVCSFFNVSGRMVTKVSIMGVFHLSDGLMGLSVAESAFALGSTTINED